MLLSKEQNVQYSQEIGQLYKTELGEDPAHGLIYFAVLSDSGDLQAIAALRCYMGTWYLRGDVVKPEFRGKKMQRFLIQERIAYLNSLKKRPDVVRVSVFASNTHSIANMLAEGFTFEKNKKLDSGETVNVYRRRLR